MNIMEDEIHLTPDTLIEQWLFDYYIDKCVKSCQAQEVDESSKRFLDVLMSHSIDPNFGLNETKANVLIILHCQLQLSEFEISDFGSSNSRKLLQSKEATTELFEMLSGLRESLLNLLHDEKSGNVGELCRTSLLYLHAYILQMLHRLKIARDKTYEASELKNFTRNILKKSAKDLASATKKEKAILKACQDLHQDTKSKPGKDLPTLNDLINLLGKLVQQVHTTFSKPEILKVGESFLRLQTKLTEIGNKDLLTWDHSSRLSLEKCAQQNNSSSADESRSRKRKSPSDSGSETCSPEKAGRSETCDRSQSPQSRPSVPKQKEKPPAVDPGPESKSWSKKPASHTRIKKGAWSTAEEEQFVVSVLRIGVGKWAEVKEELHTLRSSVQLKDKWRNIPKSRIRSIALQHKLTVPK